MLADDVLRARLKTLGVTEYKFSIREGVWNGAAQSERIVN